MLDDTEISNKQTAFGGDFNLIFDCKLETNGGNPVLKKKSLTKLIELNESLNLCDISRMRNLLKKCYTFHQNRVSGFIQRRLIIFLFQIHFKILSRKQILLHLYPLTIQQFLFSFEKGDGSVLGRGLSKFN